jgi:biopolymer transport protein ExbD
MAFGSFESGGSQPMAEINTTPLVDVMLVLLVIFIITAPLLTHAIRLDLPQASAEPAAETPETIALSIDASGGLYWNNEPVAGFEALAQRLAEAATNKPPPDLHVRADRETRYQWIAQVMSVAQQAGISGIAFVTDPGVSPGSTTAPASSTPATASGAAQPGGPNR